MYFFKKLFCYFKQQILYYFSVQDIVVNYKNVDYHNEILDELNDLEILLLFFPHIKDIEGLKTVRTLKDIFLKRKDNNFQFRVILLIIFIFNVSCIYACWHNKIMPL